MRMRILSLLSLCSWIAFFLPSWAEERSLPQAAFDADPHGPARVNVFRLEEEPFLDGKIEPAEGGAPFLLKRLDGQGQFPQALCWVRLGWCERGLYVGLRAEEPLMRSRRIKDKGSQTPSWEDDILEIFLVAPEGSGTYHLGINPMGQKLSEIKADPVGVADTCPPDPLVSQPGPEFMAVVGERGNEWTVEMVVPLLDMSPTSLERNKPWKICVARSRKVEGLEENSSWPALEGDGFHQPDGFADLVLRDPDPNQLLWIQARKPARRQGFGVTPLPQCAKVSSCFRTRLEPDWHVAWGEQGQAAVEDWRRHLELRLGWRWKGERLDPDTGPRRKMLVGSAREHPRLERDWARAESRISRDFSWQRDSVYVLTVDSRSVRLVSENAQGFRFGMQTLKQWMDIEGRLKRGWIVDGPLMHWRAWHLVAPETSGALEEAYRLIEVLARFKFNVLTLQIDNRLQYERIPALSKKEAVSKEELSALVRHAESLGFEVIPMTQCWSHFNYFLTKKEFQHLAEIPEPAEDQRRKFWNYCPRHPEVHDLLFDMIEEQLECFPHAAYFHVGLDEITFEPIGVCERCRDSEPWEIFAEEVIRLHAFVWNKGLRMCMWGDQLLVEHGGGPPFFTAKALEVIPRDILVFDWHYGESSEFPSVAFFQEKGFEVLGCGWYEPSNVMNFSDVCFREKALGYSGTSWWRIDRFIEEPRLMAAVALTAENTWSPGSPAMDAISWEPVHRFREIYDLGESLQRPNRFAMMDLSLQANGSLRYASEGISCVDAGPRNDYEALRPGIHWIEGVPFRVMRSRSPSEKDCVLLADHETEEGVLPLATRNIPVGACFSRLAFLQSCTRPKIFSKHIYDSKGQNPGHIAQYQVLYRDGSSQCIPLRWNKEISHWNSRLGSAKASGGWTGKTRAGELVRLDRFVWENPRPEEIIVAIDMESQRDQVRPFLVAITGIQDH